VGRRKSDVGCGMWEGGAGGCVGKAGAPSAPPTRFARHRSLEGGCRMGAGDGSALHGSRLEEHGPRVEDAARTVARQGNGESVGPWEVKARAASGRDLRLLRRLRGKTKDKSEWICSPPGKPGGKRPAPLRGCGEDTITRIIRSQPGKSGGKRPAPLRGCGEGTIARFICSPPDKPGGPTANDLRRCAAAEKAPSHASSALHRASPVASDLRRCAAAEQARSRGSSAVQAAARDGSQCRPGDTSMPPSGRQGGGSMWQPKV